MLKELIKALSDPKFTIARMATPYSGIPNAEDYQQAWKELTSPPPKKQYQPKIMHPKRPILKTDPQSAQEILIKNS